jgi:hypothetical protein
MLIVCTGENLIADLGAVMMRVQAKMVWTRSGCFAQPAGDDTLDFYPLAQHLLWNVAARCES